LRWYQALQGTAVLSENTKRSMFQSRVKASEKVDYYHYGYGWQIFTPRPKDKMIGHGGAESGVGHYAWWRWYVDQDQFVVMLSNAPEKIAVAARARLADILATKQPGT
jgi:hypothetical protein